MPNRQKREYKCFKQLKIENDSTQALALETSHFSLLGWGGGILGESHVFQGERKGDQSSLADY